MARRTNDVSPELIPIDAVAAHVGVLPEHIWSKLDRADVQPNWAYTPCVSAGKARQLVDAFAAAAQEAEKITAERQQADQEKQEREAERLRREAAAARPPDTGRVLHGVQVFTPGGEPEPGWANAPIGDES